MHVLVFLYCYNIATVHCIVIKFCLVLCSLCMSMYLEPCVCVYTFSYFYLTGDFSFLMYPDDLHHVQ